MRIIPFLLVLCIFFGCGSEKQKETTIKLATTQNEVAIQYAQKFSISELGSYKILTIKSKGSTSQKYILYKKGTEKPITEEKNVIYVQTPVSSVACLSSLYVGFLNRLGSTQNIVAVDNIDYISNKEVNEKVASGKTTQLAIAGKLNEEMTMSVKPELVINYGSGNLQTDRNEKLYNAGIPMVFCLDHLETTPLGRAEWIKFIACFFEKETLADSLFTETENNYITLKAEAAKAPEKPSVLTELKLNDAWYVPGGKSFMATLIKDANAHYCWENDTAVGSLPLSFEQVYKVGADSDYWLNVLFAKTKTDISKLDKRYMDFKAFKNNTIYNNNLQITDKGGNAYWETGLISPDLILSDLIYILHPEFGKGKKLNYYRKLE